MKKTAKITAFVIGGILILGIIIYASLAIYYSSGFLYGTWINNYYCTGLTAENAELLILNDEQPYTLTLFEENGTSEVISGDQFDFSTDYLSGLEDIKRKQNVYYWGYYLLNPQYYEVKPEYLFDESKLLAQVEQLNCFKLEAYNQNQKLEISKTADGYKLVDQKVNTIDQAKVKQLILEAVAKGERELSLIDHDCYEAYQYTDEEKSILELWEKIDRLQNSKLVLKDGKIELTLEGTEAASWLVKEGKDFLLDENGALVLDQEKLEEFLKKEELLFNSSGASRVWQRPNDGKIITINTKGKKYEVDTKQELDEINKALSAGHTMTRKPFYAKVGEPRSEINMGNTYIEVDMAEQKLYYYKDRELILTSDTVTGNTSRGNGTPEAVCEIYFMQKNRTLRGADYASFVHYWIAVKGRIGIHDATWRDKFGGDIYKTNGSHGCINLPKENAAKLYEMVETGIPVILHY
ncbi:MAG: L,D-transpeptidase [Clostridia bacterium]|nr:L,D-transpeptidase [Clostridia bacterium]